jgi:hypothetical protein
MPRANDRENQPALGGALHAPKDKAAIGERRHARQVDVHVLRRYLELVSKLFGFNRLVQRRRRVAPP